MLYFFLLLILFLLPLERIDPKGMLPRPDCAPRRIPSKKTNRDATKNGKMEATQQSEINNQTATVKQSQVSTSSGANNREYTPDNKTGKN
mmetsp:Transcript_17111/g.37365  ORF Transcript_17111/g.37365 Transcript_17111/m.37365 type:complete len:90 (-) Transcript_17111:49-318(-)